MKLKLVAAILLFYLLIPFMSVGQSTRTERVVRGTVTSATDGQTLPGTTVIEADDNKRIITATITDINGQYVLRIKILPTTLLSALWDTLPKARRSETRP